MTFTFRRLHWYRQQRDEAQPAPTVAAITPATGSAAGGVAITNLAGTGFAAGATVTIGGLSCTSVVVESDTKITCVTPAAGSIAGLGAKDVVVTNADAQTGTLAGGYTQRLELSYETDGVNEYASNTAITAISNAEAQAAGFSFAGWFYENTNSDKYMAVMSVNDASTCIFFNSYDATRIGATIRDAGVPKFERLITAGSLGSWVFCCIERTAAGVWRACAGTLGGSLATSTTAAWDGMPAVTKLGLSALHDGTAPFAGKCAVLGVWMRPLITTGEAASWFAAPQSVPSSARNLTCPGLGDTIAGGLTDRGSDGTYDLACQNGEAGDIAAAYPGVA